MIEIYILDKDLNRIHIIDNYKSLIWANRYDDIGDCELMINATLENLKMFQDCAFLSRDDDDMVCRIRKIQLITDKEEGDYLIITGYDVKSILSQRIIWRQTNFSGLAEDYLRQLVVENLINPNLIERKINNFELDNKVGFKEILNQQVTYDNLNTKIQEIIRSYHWGYKVPIVDKKFKFQIYKGKDRTNTVSFSDNYENISSTEYNEDKTDIANVALVAGEGTGVNRITNTIGKKSGIERFEIYVDAREISKNISYDDLITTYPGGTEIILDNITYYQNNGINIAIINRDKNNVQVTLIDNIYSNALESKGLEAIATHNVTKSFMGCVIPNITFEYKKDYNLGDVVYIENKYGISAEARIVEVVEFFDDTGYSVEPKFEYIEETENAENQQSYLLNEDETILLTETNEYLILEENGNYDVQQLNLELNIQNKKISELLELLKLQDNSYIAVAVSGQTKKISYENLKIQLNQELSFIKDGSINTFDGDYNSLINKPFIPSKISDLKNDSNFIKLELDPTVPKHVKEIKQSDIEKWNNSSENKNCNIILRRWEGVQ